MSLSLELEGMKSPGEESEEMETPMPEMEPDGDEGEEGSDGLMLAEAMAKKDGMAIEEAIRRIMGK